MFAKMSFKKKSNNQQIENILKKYTTIDQNTEVKKVMKNLGEECIRSLIEKGPYETGEYSNGWTCKVESDSSSIDANIYNSSHPEIPQTTGSNLSELLTYGHGTGTGGYVKGNTFIKDSVDAVDTTKIGGVIANVK